MKRIVLFTLASALALLTCTAFVEPPRWAQASESAPVEATSDTDVSSVSGELTDSEPTPSESSPLPAVCFMVLVLLVVLKFAFGGNS